MQDGTHYRADREGGTVTVSDEHAPHVRREVGGDAGLTGHGSFRVFGGTREGRFAGLDERGALLLETPAGVERILAGDISLGG